MAYKDPEKAREATNRWRKANLNRRRASDRRWRQANPEKTREAARKHNYGISPQHQREMLDEQDHRCAICKKLEKLHLDHCHKTKKVRAFLCRRCNLGIGHLGDDVQVLIEAARYLLQHQKKG